MDARGEILELKETVNLMVDQLNGLASEVTRVAREVGAEGKLGGEAEVRGVGGVWKELASNINYMSASLTNRTRNIAESSLQSPTATCPRRSRSTSRASCSIRNERST